MKSISLTDNEINHIKEVYSQELEKLQKRTAEITTILKKIEGHADAEPIPAEKKKGRKKNTIAKKLVAEPIPTIEPKRPGRKPKASVTFASVSAEAPKAKRGRPAKQKAEPKQEAIKESTTTSVAPKLENKSKSKKLQPKQPKAKKEKVAKPVKVKAEKAVKVEKPVKVKAEKPAKVKAEKPAKVKAEKPIKVKAAKPAKVKAAKVKAAKPAKAKAEKAVKVKAEKPVKVAKAKKTTIKLAATAKPGRKKSADSKKSKWTVSILEILEKEGKVQSSRQILDQIMVKQNITESERAKTRSSVTGSLSDLKLETKRIKSIPVPGQKGELYGLSQWYDEAGNLLEQYKN